MAQSSSNRPESDYVARCIGGALACTIGAIVTPKVLSLFGSPMPWMDYLQWAIIGALVVRAAIFLVRLK
jgi:uncharacterized membrane protein YeaQ/YmgE (transglycosylase-associated protein family)